MKSFYLHIGRYIAIVSTTVETSTPISELQPGFDIIGTVLERYIIINNNSLCNNNIYIFNTYVSDKYSCNFYLMMKFYFRFDSVSDLLEPISDGVKDKSFISKSYDATSHFETCADDVLSLYTRYI